jgi:hypothetical protein
VGPQPQFVGDSLSAIVDQLAERYAS